MTLFEFCRDFFSGEEIFSAGEGGMAVHSCHLLELEYAGKESKQLSWEQVLPSDILELLQPGNWNYYDPRCGENNQRCWNGERSFLLTEETLQILQRFHLVIDPEVVGMVHARRPYFRMRGRPVMEEQAFDILRRTNIPPTYDNKMERYPWKDLVYNGGFLDNKWCGWIPRGWVLPDGTVGMNNHSSIKYPYESEIVTEIIRFGLTFPYLDLVIAITDWDEAPDYARDAYFGKVGDGYTYDGDDEVFQREDYPDFLEHVILGVWLHGDTVELMAPERAREKYAEYNRLYGGPDEEIFKEFYYKNRGLRPVDLAYLKRLIRAHGLDPEEVLAGYEWGPLELRRQYREPEKNDPGQLNGLGGDFP